MKKILALLSECIISFSIFAFDWPIQNIQTDNIKSFFAQKRGTTISSSVLLEPKAEKGSEEEFVPIVKNCEAGNILIIISDIEDDNDFFPSTLGQAVIISHTDNIISVYGNLSKDSNQNIEDKTFIDRETEIGTISNTAWTEKKNSLEFKLIDIKRSLAVNPRTILPRLEKEKSFAPSEIIVENKDGKRFELANNKSFLSGNYKFYQKRNDYLVPEKVSITVNGELTDEILFDEIFQKDNTIYLTGLNQKYSLKSVYPDDKLFLMGEAKIQKGKSVITFENTSFSGEKRLSNYIVNIY